ncbi:S41 family peptidase [Lysobacter solisilvae (ex Woo and Kim 2022)]|uniref:Peptidase S41 n=1 Tax=Agrilutibacter terrestris TaxID=2865112 RepID=A0A7H0G0E6_9GAMM|nr:S41 family peptidase [Lysobacter terrestris]QNP41762.1 peptidase S41 [Lysobacter terrestris]
MRALTLVLPLLLALAGLARAADAPLPRIQPEALRSDVDLLQQAFEALHPGLYRYRTPRQVRADLARLRAEFDQPRGVDEAYLALTRFSAALRCGHTYPNFHNQSRAVQQALFERDDRVPFRLRWLDGAMVVTRDYSGHAAMRPGTRVLAIDGVAAADLLARMLPLTRADGGNDAKRMAQLDMRGNDQYETFDILLSLLQPAAGGQRRYRVQAPGAAAPVELELPSLSYAARLAQRDVPDTKGDAPAWTLDLGDPAFAVLRMPSWALYDSRWDWQGFLAQSFATLVARRAPALVIDLRGNEGGLDIGDELLAHLAQRPLALPAYRRLVRYRAVPAALVPYLDTWDPSFKDWGAAARPYDARYFELRRDGDDDGSGIAPRAPRYAGRVFVLTDAANSSATFQFALQARRSGLATLVGQATGGNRRGINGGAFFFLRLPGSGLEMDLPLIGRFPVAPEPDAGVDPDIAVALTADDIGNGRDAALAAVRAALQEAPR